MLKSLNHQFANLLYRRFSNQKLNVILAHLLAGVLVPEYVLPRFILVGLYPFAAINVVEKLPHIFFGSKTGFLEVNCRFHVIVSLLMNQHESVYRGWGGAA